VIFLDQFFWGYLLTNLVPVVSWKLSGTVTAPVTTKF